MHFLILSTFILNIKNYKKSKPSLEINFSRNTNVHRSSSTVLDCCRTALSWGLATIRSDRNLSILQRQKVRVLVRIFFVIFNDPPFCYPSISMFAKYFAKHTCVALHVPWCVSPIPCCIVGCRRETASFCALIATLFTSWPPSRRLEFNQFMTNGCGMVPRRKARV